MFDWVRLFSAGLVLSAAITAGASRAIGADAADAPKPGDVSCSCRACSQQVCCDSPSGFAPLDEKCRLLCETKHWVVAGNGSCGSQPGCCPAK